VLKDVVLRCRSYRRFAGDHIIDEDTMLDMIDHARLTASAANRQPLKYIFSVDPGINGRIFDTIKWAGYLPEWDGPVESERPTGYVIILGDRDVSENFFFDHGISGQTLMIAAAERGLGGCMILAFDRDELRSIFDLSDRYDILLVLALGKPVEKVVIEEIDPDDDIKYYRDPDGVHHVPKRKLSDLIVKRYPPKTI